MFFPRRHRSQYSGTGSFVGAPGISVPSGAALWTPADIDTDLWLDAADASTFTLTGSAIDEWRDKSGNGRHFTAAGASRPTLTADAIGGLPAVEPDGVDDFMSPVNGCGGSWPCMTAVIYVPYTPFNGGMLGGQNWPNRSLGSGLNAWVCVYHVNTAMAYQVSTAGVPYMAIGSSAAADHQLFVDGVSRATSTAGGAPLSSFEIGRHPMFGAYNRSRIGEILVIPGRDTAVRQKLEGYWAHKWGRLAALPVDHPYKVNQPTK